MHPAHVLAAYHPATVYGHPVPQSASALIAIAFLIGLAIVVARGLASFGKK